MTIAPAKLQAAAAVTSILRAGGRSTTRRISRDVGIPTRRTLRSLELAHDEGLVWTRDRNVWQATTKARELFDAGAQAARDAVATDAEATAA